MNVLLIKNMMKANLNRLTLKSSSLKSLSLKGNTLKILALTCTLALFNTAHAAKADLAQEITIKSQRQAADLKNKIASYLDNVSISQGSIAISADIVKVFSQTDKKSGEKVDTYLAKGDPAIFQQQLEDGSLIKLQADEITYNPNIHMIIISGNALVKQAGSEVSGDEISYNTLSEKLEAKSTNNQSVTTILQPAKLKKQKEANQRSDTNKTSTSDITTKQKIKQEGDSRDN